MNRLQLDKLEAREVVPGCIGRFVHSDNMTISHWAFEAGAVLLAHSHPHEQVANFIEGEFELTVAGETQHLGPGDVVIISPNVVHSGRAISECYIIDAFYPVREDYR